jgi:hypothetical protein
MLPTVRLIFVTFALLIGGCNFRSDAFLIHRAIFPQPTPLNNFQSGLNPDWRYMALSINQRSPILLVMGYEEALASNSSKADFFHQPGLVESWYSSDRELLQTWSGLVLYATGLPGYAEFTYDLEQASKDDVRQLKMHFSWDQVSGRKINGVVDLSVFPQASGVVPAEIPAKALPFSGDPSVWADWEWVRLLPERHSHSWAEVWLAFGQHRGNYGVVYSYQCVQPQICFRLMKWPYTN